MNEIVSNLLVYGSLPEDSILWQLADICEKLKNQTESKDALRGRVFHQVKNLLTVATDYAFDKNLWHNYLTYLLITNENPFSITCEKVGASEGSVNHFAKSDFKAFKELFDFDFSRIEDELGVDCFSRISDYQAIGKPELMYNKNVSEKVQALSERLETAKDENEFFDMVTDFYKAYGVGMFGLNKAFRIEECGDNNIRFRAINNMDKVVLSDLVGYEIQKQKLVENTEAFVEGRKANKNSACPNEQALLLYQTILMKSDELDDSHLGSVTAARAGLVDAGVTTVAISILGADLVDDLLGDIFLGDVGVDLTLSVQIFLLTEGDHLLCHGRNFLGEWFHPGTCQ